METYNDITKYAKIPNVFCGWTKGRENMKKAQDFSSLNCTPFVRQYDILNNKWGDFLCQEEYQINDIHQNSRKW